MIDFHLANIMIKDKSIKIKVIKTVKSGWFLINIVDL